jgi:hypothetical protein
MKLFGPVVKTGKCIQHWMKRHAKVIVACELMGLRVHKWFWRFWSHALTGLVLTNPHAPHYYSAIATSIAIEMIVLLCDMQEKDAQKAWEKLQ